MDIIFEKWNEILERIREEYEISDVPFRTFLQPLTIHSVKDNVITILVPTERVGLDYTKRKYSLPLKVVIEEMDVAAMGYAPTLHMNLDTEKLRNLGWKAEVGLADMFKIIIVIFINI